MLLLDTCALIWLINRTPIQPPALEEIERAARDDALVVSTASAWEIGLLSRRIGRSDGLQFTPDPKTWFVRALTAPGLRLAPLTPDIAIDASHLPGELHGDPADRLIIATARHLGAAIVTRDRKILDYAAAGFVGAIAC
ncbi:type II toxin-antitoxin system VapC family toxin [Phenylobacterium sp.]|uniref:type II toxin-antitoxin system VapC family toxin n=1 Tax=Phenylobacterium sp. TaxID=1871053 RepID=UPI0027288557|nr:type II toxin-antitoxin system VapC family toxin [Phenylobacterium sp.]MDO8380649.1 type II toxin-antitoxin system VapC family toxin [Phenylobacterium sp.]